MNNPLTKIGRYLRREYPWTAVFTGGGIALGLAVGTILTLVPGAPMALWAIPALAAGLFGGIGFLSAIGEEGRPNSNQGFVGGMTIVGRPRDVASVTMTQKLITSLTEKQRDLPELPARTAKRIARHLDDIRGAAAHVRAYAFGGEPLAAIGFSREVIGAAGKTARQSVGEVETPMTGREARAALTHATAAPGLAETPAAAAAFNAPAARAENAGPRAAAPETPAAPDKAGSSAPAPGKP